MAGLYETDQIGQKQEISNAVFNIRADETPFTSMLPKDKKPHNKICTWQVEDYRDGSLQGVMDGADVSSFNHQPRFLLTGVCQKHREPWFVSDFADVSDVAGLPKGEKGRQKVVAMKVLKFQMEGRALSNEECSVDNGVDTPNEMRGVFRWLQTAAQATYPVNSNFRPSSSVVHTTALSNLTETAFENMLSAAYQEKRGKLDLDGFVGVTLKLKMDNWTARDAEVDSSTRPVRLFTQSAAKKAMIKVVSFMQFSTGTVRLHLSTFLYKDTDGSNTNYTHRSGAFLDMSMWSAAFNRKPRMAELQDQGGGPRGFADCIWTVKCKNPLGQPVVVTDSDS